MLVKSIYLLVLIVVLPQAHFAQFVGGNGDGYTNNFTSALTLNNTMLTIIYQGSNGDGYTAQTISATTLSNTPLLVLYSGGNGDGSTKNLLTATTLSNTMLAALYTSSNGDGFTIFTAPAVTLNNTSLAALYSGSHGDGYTNKLLTATTLTNTMLAVLYSGANGDGYTNNLLTATTLNNTNLMFLYAGGSGDGYTKHQVQDYLNPYALVDLVLQINVLLQGPILNPINTNLMNDDLRFLELIPTTSPYTDAAIVNPTVLQAGGSDGLGFIENDIVDWVFIELRDAANNTNVINSASALLQRDGDVVSLDGVSNLKIKGLTASYYVVVKHRNHNAVMSQNPAALSTAPATINFTNGSTAPYGNHALVNIGDGKLALWAGDANQNKTIKFSGANNDSNTIKDKVLADSANFFNLVTFESLGYYPEDIDMDGGAKFSGTNNDSNLIKDNVLNHPGNLFHLETFTIQNTVPNSN